MIKVEGSGLDLLLEVYLDKLDLKPKNLHRIPVGRITMSMLATWPTVSKPSTLSRVAFQPQNTTPFAIPQAGYIYVYASSHVMSLLSSNGFRSIVVLSLYSPSKM